MMVCRSVGSAVRQPRKGGCARLDIVADALAGLLLVDQGGQLDRAAQPHAAKRRQGGERCRETAFHVGGAAAVDAAVVHCTAERVRGPALADRDDVGVPEQQNAGPGAALQRDAQVVAARLDRCLDHVQTQLDGCHVQHVHRRRLTAGRILPGRPHQRRGQVHQRCFVDPVQHGLLCG